MSKQLHGVSDRFFFWRSVGGLSDTMEVGGAFSAAVLKDVLSLKMGRSVASVVRSYVSDHRVAQMMDHFTQYVGSSPYASPAVLCGIAHMQTDEGIWYPIGGTRAVPEALGKLAGELGVEIRVGTDVMQIATDGDQVRGVVTADGNEIACDAVVSNCDAVRTYRELLKGTPQSNNFMKRNRHQPACSGVVLYLGLDRRYEQLLHHNFVFSRDPEEEFDWIYRKGDPAPDPSAYVCAPAISEPEVAPDGCEALVHFGAHALPAPPSQLEGDVAQVPRSDSGQARADGGHGGTSRCDSLRGFADAGGDSQSISCSRRSDLRFGESRQIRRRLQASQSSQGFARTVPGRRSCPSRSRHADGLDERMDRRRLTRQRPGKWQAGGTLAENRRPSKHDAQTLMLRQFIQARRASE